MDRLAGATVRPCGEDAFVVEYGDTIDEAIGDRVAALASAFDAARPPGLVEVVPTFRSCLVLFDPDETSRDAILSALPERAEHDAAEAAHWSIPVCLEGEAAEDLQEAAEGLGLAPEAVRERFIAGTYRVGMYGFAPGFAYLAGLDPALAIPRRETPRPPMAQGAVIIAGGMAALNSAALPTGWYVIGASAMTLFRPQESPMVPFAVGDTIRFHAVAADELERHRTDPVGGATRQAR